MARTKKTTKAKSNSKSNSKTKSKSKAKTEATVLIELHANDPAGLSGQTLAVFSKSSSAKDGVAQIEHLETAKALVTALEEKIVTGSASEVCSFREARFLGYRNVLTVGLGTDEKLTHEVVRQAAAALYKEAKSIKSTEIIVDFDGITSGKKNVVEFMRAFVEGIMLASYRFDELKAPSKKIETMRIQIVSTSANEKPIRSAYEEGLILAECTNFARRLGDMPGNLMTPSRLAQEAIAAAKGSRLKVTAWDKKRIAKENMGGLLGVAQGSAQEPRFIVMEYKGGGTKKPVAYVGKGLTFDSGGISIKPGAKMEEMKFDMMGGAAVIGTMLAIARLKLKVNAVAYVPATENMPGSRATKPGDVHTARNGKTFEINNTDAEGRLILADALTYASEQKPQAIFDAATLTGAMVVALGNIHTGYFTRNANLKSKIETAAIESGELVWNMPLVDQHLKDIKGTYADLSNISYTGGAGSATAAAFLEQFVGSEIPWAHFDIAGTGWACGNRLNYCTAKGGTGVMVRTFVELAKTY